MRRITTIAAAAALLSPLVLVTGGSASAAGGSGSLDVTTLGRSGKAVSTTLSVYDTKTHAYSQLSSGHVHTLAKGTYEVFADIWDSADGTDTLGAKAVTVSGAAKATIDARQGHVVKASLSPSPGSGYQQTLSAAVCGEGVPYGAQTANSAGKLYVIPSADSAFELAYSSTWNSTSGAGHDVFVGVGDHAKGLPSGVSATFKQSSLATVKLDARRGPETGDAQLQLSGDYGSTCMWGVEGANFQDTLPYSATAHVPAGQWEVSESAQDYLSDFWQNYSAGRTYSVGMNHAGVGPAGDMPYIWAGQHRLYLNTDEMFGDDSLVYGGSFSATYTLKKGGTTLLSRTLGASSQATLNPVLTRAGWYDLSVSAKRSPGHALASDALSTASSLSFHFYTDLTTYRQVRGYITRFWPTALNSRNQAAPGSRTTVALYPKRPAPTDDFVHQLSDSVKKVQAWYSTDGGKTWHGVAVSASGSHWAAVVPNPASGRVSLRSEVTDSHGDTTTTTVDNVYAIG